jgi:hypothetical protein
LANLEPMPFTLAELGQLFAVSRCTAYRVGAGLSHDGIADDADVSREDRQPTRDARE